MAARVGRQARAGQGHQRQRRDQRERGVVERGLCIGERNHAGVIGVVVAFGAIVMVMARCDCEIPEVAVKGTMPKRLRRGNALREHDRGQPHGEQAQQVGSGRARVRRQGHDDQRYAARATADASALGSDGYRSCASFGELENHFPERMQAVAAPPASPELRSTTT